MRDTRFEVFVIFILSALAVTLVVLFLRHRNQQMLHQERLTALEKGTSVPSGRMPAPWSPRVYLLRGLMWTFSGAALVVCLLGVAWSSQRPQSASSMAWSAKMLSQQLDISLDQAKQLVQKDQEARVNGMPASIALFGLIPIGVGLAYLVFYYTDESRKTLEPGPLSETLPPRA